MASRELSSGFVMWSTLVHLDLGGFCISICTFAGRESIVIIAGAVCHFTFFPRQILYILKNLILIHYKSIWSYVVISIKVFASHAHYFKSLIDNIIWLDVDIKLFYTYQGYSRESNVKLLFIYGYLANWEKRIFLSMDLVVIRMSMIIDYIYIKVLPLWLYIKVLPLWLW